MRSYTATGEPRYLLYYYDILGVRQGEKVAPSNFNPDSYWDDVIAGRIKHDIPKEGPKRSISYLMKSQGFSNEELLALKRVIDATGEMNKVEQIAFAATQGLYNPETKEFVSDGQPRLDFASNLVHSANYNALKANLSTAVGELVAMTDRRTANRQRWMAAYEAELIRHVPALTGKVDWDAAAFFYNRGDSSRQAAQHIAARWADHGTDTGAST